jgi:DNA-binding CsgD family transcriptional regulator
MVDNYVRTYIWLRRIVIALADHETSSSEVMHDLTVLLVDSKTPYSYVRSCATHSLFGKHALGAELFVINADASLNSLAAFGRSLYVSEQRLSLWDQNPISEAARTGLPTNGTELIKETGSEVYYYCYPFSSSAHTIGVMVMIKSSPYEVTLGKQDQRTASMFGGLWLERMGTASQKTLAAEPHGELEELSSRQQVVLEMIAKRSTNAKIADALGLSESTIRQETVKIYRKLAVPNRTEATKKATLLGLL